MNVEQSDKLSRRDFVKIAVVSTLTVAGVFAGVDQIYAAGEMRQHLEDLALGTIDFHPPEFNTLPPLDRCKNTGRLFVIGHYGYLANQGYLQAGYDSQTEGSYPIYWHNTSHLITALSQTKEPTMFAVEDRVFQRNDAPSTGCSSVIVTINLEGMLKRYIHTSEGLQEQNIESTITALKQFGIHTICFAGEQVYKPGEGAGCVVEEVTSFINQFNIASVEGCLYPLFPPKHPNDVERQLYEHTVPIPSG